MFEATLEKADTLKKILDAVKELVTDANLDCSEDAIKLQAMDNSHVALVSLELKKDAFSEFRCDRDMTLGMNLTSLQKIIRCANSDDNCKLTAVEDADSLNIQFQGKRAARMGEYDMKLMDIDSEQLGIPETDYDAKIQMPSGEFAKIIRDLKELGESVKIEATHEGVKFTSEGEIGTGAVTVKPTGGSSKRSTKAKKDSKVKAKKEEDMSEDEDDVKPDVKDESDDEEEESSEEENDEEDEEDEDGDEDRNSKKRPGKSLNNGKSKSKPKKKAKTSGGDEDDSRVVIVEVSQSVALNFSIKYLNNFAKSTPLSDNVKLSMSNDVPLLVEYQWEGGSIKFYLAPKIADD